METQRNDYMTTVGSDQRTAGYRISIARIIFLSIASFGLYWFYWMYCTWKQYRDHTGATAYPVWHVLTQFVPIYGYFRFYAHGKAYKNLMEARGIESSLNLTAIVVIVIIARVAIDRGFIFVGLDADLIAEYQLILNIISLIALTVMIAVLCWIQTNINRYWAAVGDGFESRARIGKGEILVVVVGILVWIGLWSGWLVIV